MARRFSGRSSVVLISSSINLMKVSIPTARTSGSAQGSSSSGSGCWEAIARDAATAVAVAPTLDARSQVSFSVRAIHRTSFHEGYSFYLGDLSDTRLLYASRLRAPVTWRRRTAVRLGPTPLSQQSPRYFTGAIGVRGS